MVLALDRSSSHPSLHGDESPVGSPYHEGNRGLQFPWRLHEMLAATSKDARESSIISWRVHGRAFRVDDRDMFATLVMPKFFKQTRYKSFQRQLHLWGFKRINQGADEGSYFHPHFLRGMPDRCRLMCRQKIKGNLQDKQHSIEQQAQLSETFARASSPSSIAGTSSARQEETAAQPTWLSQQTTGRQQQILAGGQDHLLLCGLIDSIAERAQNATFLAILQRRLQERQAIQRMAENIARLTLAPGTSLPSHQNISVSAMMNASSSSLPRQHPLLDSLTLSALQGSRDHPRRSPDHGYDTTTPRSPINNGHVQQRSVTPTAPNETDRKQEQDHQNSTAVAGPAAAVSDSMVYPRDAYSATMMHDTNNPTSCTSSLNLRSQSIPFPWKLHEMLNDMERAESNQCIVSWLPHGHAFKVHNPDLFVSNVMPKYFRQTKFKSFQRQLNLWGFERSTKGADKGSYAHPYFIRGDKSKCRLMNHTSVKGTSLRRPAAPSRDDVYNSPEDFINQIDDLQIRQDVRTLHELIQQIEPSLKPQTNFKGTLGYGTYKYHYKNGREGEWCKLGISHGKQITLHCSGISATCGDSNSNEKNGDGNHHRHQATSRQQYVLEDFVDKFPKAKVGMTSLRFQRLADLDLRTLKEVIRATAASADGLTD